nr:hypothetical protein [Verrucomicrobiota bacterium]
YGERVVEVEHRSEAEVAGILRSSKVLVWRGSDKEGSPRPPKEALVAGCHVVGLAHDLDAAHGLDFGIRRDSLAEVIASAGEALRLPIPGEAERAVVRDSADERADWEALLRQLPLPSSL